jgi:hypothetical protein
LSHDEIVKGAVLFPRVAMPCRTLEKPEHHSGYLLGNSKGLVRSPPHS